MLMVTAPLYWPPACNVGSLCITPVCPCRYHPPESRGAVERSCIYEWEVLYSSTSNPLSLRFLHVSLVLAPHPQLQSSLPKALASGRELLWEEVRLPHKPSREGEVVENTTALLQHWPQAALPGNCACIEDAWWDSQTFWLPLLPTVSSKQFGTASLFNSCFPLQAHGQNKLMFLSQMGKHSQIGCALNTVSYSFPPLFFSFPFACVLLFPQQWLNIDMQHWPNKKNEHMNKYELKQRAFQWQGSLVCSKPDGSKKAPTTRHHCLGQGDCPGCQSTKFKSGCWQHCMCYRCEFDVGDATGINWSSGKSLSPFIPKNPCE